MPRKTALQSFYELKVAIEILKFILWKEMRMEEICQLGRRLLRRLTIR